MKSLFDTVSVRCSKLTTRAYSTSFSLGIYFLKNQLRNPIYSIYGFVRFADEIVDSFDGYDKEYLLKTFKKETYEAIENGISLNPILNSFQHAVHEYNIDHDLIETFLKSMEMDLDEINYSQDKYEQYILGSAEVVGLMCLHVFTEGDKKMYEELKPSAMKLGAAFQKVNFLRDIKADYNTLGRSYFPNIDLTKFSTDAKRQIENEIEDDFKEALIGIKRLPRSAKGGVYLAYVYYNSLFKKIKRVPAQRIMSERIRISNGEKFHLMLNSMFQYKLNLL
ncbi:MAG: phytoene/squalene synthase family protein [Bacteroidetes bacterium]|nr:phytoene/squalene synthase family protein [Bacteroidota bacterium]